jgi:ATP-dependent RNA helicase RhlB
MSDWQLDSFVVPPSEGKMRFHDLDLPEPVMRAIQEQGFEYCTPIQQGLLPDTLEGHDCIGKAQTGTGKTAAFLITILADLLNVPLEQERYIGEPRALIIAPTRELVLQIAKDARGLAKYTGLNVASLIGGENYDKQLKQLDQHLVDIVVATPGRLIDFVKQGLVHLDLVELLVIDEADRMLDMGFIPQVRQIVRRAPQKSHRQTMFFSATFTDTVLDLAARWTHDPVKVEIEPERVATDTVDQKVYIVTAQKKYQLLHNIVNHEDARSVMVFANRRDETRRLYEKLTREGIRCGILSGEVPQHKRVKTLERFRSGDLRVLVATDVAGRGIHVDGVSHVINYSLPEDPEDYVHRIGRTGRAGATGTSISFACENDSFLILDIEALLGEKLECTQPPEALLA